MIDGVWCSAVLWMLKQILTHFHTGFLLWMISLSLAFNSNSDFINLLLIVVGSKSQNKWEIVVFQPALQFFSCICGSLWRLMSLCIEERIVCVLGAQLLSSISFWVPGDAHYICMRKKGKLFRFAAAHHFEWEFFLMMHERYLSCAVIHCSWVITTVLCICVTVLL